MSETSARPPKRKSPAGVRFSPETDILNFVRSNLAYVTKYLLYSNDLGKFLQVGTGAFAFGSPVYCEAGSPAIAP
jgi:hypothetical protein